MIQTLLGFDSDIIILVLAALVLILFIITIVSLVKLSGLTKRLNQFMTGSDGRSLEDNLIYRLEQIDELIEANADNERNIDKITANMKSCFKKFGLIKYDALNEMGGKLSFSLAMLDEKNDGYILNAMHTREGCYTYIKEVVAGNSIITLSEEEDKALSAALGEE